MTTTGSRRTFESSVLASISSALSGYMFKGFHQHFDFRPVQTLDQVARENFFNRGGEQVAPAALIADITIPREELRIAWRRGEYADFFPEGQYRNQSYVLNASCSQMAMLGIHGQISAIDLERELLVVGYGSYPTQVDGVIVEALLSFWQGIFCLYSV
jgi:hypothetical protein